MNKRDESSAEQWMNGEAGEVLFVTWRAMRALADEWLQGAEIVGVRDGGLLLVRPDGYAF